MEYKTPGVYVREISAVPPSVTEVATAIPAFLGCTEKAIKDGENLTGKPTRIISMPDYQQCFGGDCTPEIEGTVDAANNNAVEVATNPSMPSGHSRDEERLSGVRELSRGMTMNGVTSMSGASSTWSRNR